MFNLVKKETEKQTFSFNLAGFEKNEIEIRADSRNLMVKAEKNETRRRLDFGVTESADGRQVYFNLPRTVSYSIQTPFDFDPNRIEIEFSNGVLKITVTPKENGLTVYRLE